MYVRGMHVHVRCVCVCVRGMCVDVRGMCVDVSNMRSVYDVRGNMRCVCVDERGMCVDERGTHVASCNMQPSPPYSLSLHGPLVAQSIARSSNGSNACVCVCVCVFVCVCASTCVRVRVHVRMYHLRVYYHARAWIESTSTPQKHGYIGTQEHRQRGTHTRARGLPHLHRQLL